MNNIKKLREKLRLSQEELGKRLGVGGSAVSNWETNIANPTMEKAIELAKILNCSIDELFKGG